MVKQRINWNGVGEYVLIRDIPQLTGVDDKELKLDVLHARVKVVHSMTRLRNSDLLTGNYFLNHSAILIGELKHYLKYKRNQQSA